MVTIYDHSQLQTIKVSEVSLNGVASILVKGKNQEGQEVEVQIRVSSLENIPLSGTEIQVPTVRKHPDLLDENDMDFGC